MNEKLISQFEKEYYERPPEPCNDTENPEQWTSVLNWQVAYTDWLETKLKNLGEGEAGTGYALLSDVADLETCPFCGSEAEIKSTTFGDNPNEYFRAACKGKANHSLDCWSDTSKCAIEVWNKRV